jgi:hypothetical protein
MAQTAYRKASVWTGWWLAICLLGAAAQIGVLLYLSTSGLMTRMGAWAFVPGTLPLLIAFAIGWWVLARFNRRRVALLAQRLDPLGLSVNQQPDAAAKNEFAAPLLHLFPTLELRHGAAALRWLGLQARSAVKLRLFEHEFVTGSGKFTQVHTHTVVAWPAGHADVGDSGLPEAKWFLIGSYPWLIRRARSKGSLRDEAFASLPSQWVLHGDVATGVRFLTPQVRRELERAPQGEEWCIGAGWVCCSFRGTLDAENAAKFLAHVRAVIGSRGGTR